MASSSEVTAGSTSVVLFGQVMFPRLNEEFCGTIRPTPKTVSAKPKIPLLGIYFIRQGKC